ncbi:hypothetical protein [Cellulomonas sp. P5_C5]
MEPTVVYVHGIGNKPRREALVATWNTALALQPAVSAQMAYWADLRYASPLPDGGLEGFTDGGLAAGAGALEAGGVEPTEAFVEKTAVELGGLDASAAPLKGVLERMAYAADAAASGSDSLPDDFEVIPGPKFLRVAAFRALVKATLHDAHAYFFDQAQAEAIRDRLRAVLDDAQGPVVVVAHSLGTVVAYDVLSEPRFAGLDVPLLVTLGSPLGIQEIQDQVKGRPLAVPPSVGAWLNAADAADVVALDPTIRPEYRPADKCSDALVVNRSANRHGIAEYLAADIVRRTIAKHVGRPV